MIDQLFMQDLARDLAPPLEPVEQPATLLAAGPATSDVGQVTVQGYNESKPSGVRVGRAGISPEQSAKAGGLDRPLVALLDTLAGALKGATAQTLGLPGDIRSILDLINKEGATKYLGEPVMPTTEQMQDILPAVVPQGVANQADREYTAKMASEIGTFLPAPGIPEAAVQGVKAVTKAVKATKGLPVGMSTQAVGEGVDELGFYSAARQAVDAIQQPKGTGDQFLKQIEKTPGVKPDEIKWTGLDDFLKSKKTVTKAEVQEYLDKNRVEIKEVQLGGGKSEYPYRTADEWQGAINKAEKAKNWDEAEKLTAAWEDFELGGTTKFAKFTLPGGENYREIYMTLPPKPISEEEARVILGAAPDAKLSESDIFYASRKKQDDYIVPRAHSSGMNEGDINRIAHLRVNDRVTDGKKTLFVEEVQSDWHQQGRKQGYKDPAIKDEYQALEKELMAVNREALPYTSKGEDAPQSLIEKKVALSERMDALDKKYRQGVPDAPFKTTWSELAMKRAIQMASKGGYDRIAFTTGKTQAERYDLSKEIDYLELNKNTTGNGKPFVLRAFKEGSNQGTLLNQAVDESELEDFIGKDLAKKLIDQKPTEYGDRALSGVELQVGGEGMKGFYDDILPKFLNKYAKKWDAKVGKTTINAGEEGGDAFEVVLPNGKVVSSYASKKQAESSAKSFDGAVVRPIDNGEPVNYIDITPKMRESTLTKGQPMFAIGAGGAGAAATQQEENK